MIILFFVVVIAPYVACEGICVRPHFDSILEYNPLSVLLHQGPQKEVADKNVGGEELNCDRPRIILSSQARQKATYDKNHIIVSCPETSQVETIVLKNQKKEKTKRGEA